MFDTFVSKSSRGLPIASADVAAVVGGAPIFLAFPLFGIAIPLLLSFVSFTHSLAS